MKECACVTDHVNEFNSMMLRLVTVNIKFDNEEQALLLLSLLPNGLVKNSHRSNLSSGTTKFTFEGIRELTLGKDICRRNSRAHPVPC